MDIKVLMGCVGTLAACTTTAVTRAQPFETQKVAFAYRGQTTLVDAGQPITFSVGTVTGIETLQIYDPTGTGGDVDDVLGRVTVQGTLSGGGGELRILIASPGSTWPTTPADRAALQAPGVLHMGTQSGGGIAILNAELRRQTRLAAFVAADIHGDITVGQVQLIQAGNVDPAAVTGNIFANITAVGLDQDFGVVPLPPAFPQITAIGVIRAGNSIQGDIVAAGDADIYLPTDRATYASIGRVVVGPSEAAAGIRGDLMAEAGRIGVVSTMGPILPAETVPRIWAGNGIEQIRAVNELDPEVLLDRTLHMDVRANRNPSREGVPLLDGNLVTIQTGGSILGRIDALNIDRDVTNARLGGPEASDGPVGIFARGDLLAPVTVDYIVQGYIVARTIQAPIEIGWLMEGPIIAHGRSGPEDDPADFIVPLIRIGRADANDPDNEAYLGEYSMGFTGTNVNCFPPNLATIEDIDFLYVGVGCDEGAGPSLISAERIAELDVLQVTVFETERDEFQTHPTVPLIEAQRIDMLRIDRLREGAIWSGRFDTTFSGDFTNTNKADDFTIVGSIDIDCIGEGAQLWLDAPPSFQVTGDVLGRINVNTVPTNTAIRIGGGFGTPSSAGGCGCSSQPTPADPRPCDNVNVFPIAGEDSPRQAGAASSLFRIHSFAGLRGQLLVNTLESSGQLTAEVIINRPANGPDLFVLRDTTVSPPVFSTTYTTNSLFLGGGAIGVHPFPLYRQDAFPPQMTETSAPMIRNVTFTEPSTSQVRLRFYGPVAVPSGQTAIDTVRVLRELPNNQTEDVTAEWTAALTVFPFSPGRNQLELRYLYENLNVVPPAGVYRVTSDGAPATLVSDAGTFAFPAPVPAFTYLFTVTSSATGCGSTALDFDGGGAVDQDDLNGFITAFFTEPAAAGPGGYAVACFGEAPPYNQGFQADFDQNCVVSQEDLSAYIGLFIQECL